jgi:hypothetical protein
LRAAFSEALEASGPPSVFGVVVDGLPRDEGDLAVLPDTTMMILLDCRMDIAATRQLLRGRPGDEPEIIAKRTAEQRRLLEMDKPDGWARRRAGWQQTRTTSLVSADMVFDQLVAYLEGRSKEIF